MTDEDPDRYSGDRPRRRDPREGNSRQLCLCIGDPSEPGRVLRVPLRLSVGRETAGWLYTIRP